MVLVVPQNEYVGSKSGGISITESSDGQGTPRKSQLWLAGSRKGWRRPEGLLMCRLESAEHSLAKTKASKKP